MSRNIGNAMTNVRAWNTVMYNVNDYGIFPLPVMTDATDNLQKLVDLARSENRKSIFLPEGQYYVTELSNADEVFFFGDNASFIGGYSGVIKQLGDYASEYELNAVKEETAQKADIAYVNGQYNTLDEKINMTASGSPKGTYATLSALQSAIPTGNSNIYLVVADGKWYYWNGNTWTAGGVYQSTGLADRSVTLNKIGNDVTNFYGERVVYRATNTFEQQLALQFVYDTRNINLSGVMLKLAYDIITVDPNVKAARIKIYPSDTTEFSSQYGGRITPIVDLVQGEITHFNHEWTPSQTYNYLHCFLWAIAVDNRNKGEYYYKDFRLTIGGELQQPIIKKAYAGQVNFEEVSKTPKNLVNWNDITSISIKNRLSNAKWNVLGDSITSGTAFTTKFYFDYVSDDYGVSLVRNYGINGSTIAKVDESDSRASMALRYTAMDNDADIITVFGGTNDWGLRVPLGSMKDRTVDTFYGACHVLLWGLIDKYPVKTIAVISPIQRDLNKDGIPDDGLIQYLEVLREVAGYYSIPFLDLYRGGGIFVGDTGIIPDGTHPNATGHRIIANKIGSFLNSL